MHSLSTRVKILVNQKRGLDKLSELQRVHQSMLRDLLVSSASQSCNLPIVLFAHYQPEATSYPEGGRIHNHFDLLSSIRNSCPGTQLIYKEHPESYVFRRGSRISSVGIARDETYFEAIEKLGVLFIDSNSNLSRSSNVEIVTINGSIGLERSLSGYRTFVCTEPWYGWLPGVFHISQLKGGLSKYQEHNPEEALSQFQERVRGRLIPIPSLKQLDSTVTNDDSQILRKVIESLRERL